MSDLQLHSTPSPHSPTEQAPRVQLLDRAFQLRDGVGRQFLGLRQVVRVFERFFLEPFEAVELEVAGLDVGNGERTPAVLRALGG